MRVLVLGMGLFACSGGHAKPDAPMPDTTQSLGPIHCRTADDCIPLTGAGCFSARPRGVCASCRDTGDTCPPGTECITGGTSGATECAFRCTSDAECNIGMTCVTSGTLA